MRHLTGNNKKKKLSKPFALSVKSADLQFSLDILGFRLITCSSCMTTAKARSIICCLSAGQPIIVEQNFPPAEIAPGKNIFSSFWNFFSSPLCILISIFANGLTHTSSHIFPSNKHTVLINIKGSFSRNQTLITDINRF